MQELGISCSWPGYDLLKADIIGAKGWYNHIGQLSLRITSSIPQG